MADGLKLNRIGDSGFDLAPIAHDARVGEQPIHVFWTIGSHPVYVKIVEGARHELMMETPDIRTPFLEETLAFFETGRAD